jgi:hypothetical protein
VEVRERVPVENSTPSEEIENVTLLLAVGSSTHHLPIPVGLVKNWVGIVLSKKHWSNIRAALSLL